ncbi:MAG: hypothetical protein ACLFN5_04170 [bacterium]
MSEEVKFDFSSDAAARESMTCYIRKHFSDLLGDKIKLLDAPNGIELLHQEVRSMIREQGMSAEELIKVA